jgi:hypothetical protein
MACNNIFSGASVTVKLHPSLRLLVFFRFSAFGYPRITNGETPAGKDIIWISRTKDGPAIC